MSRCPAPESKHKYLLSFSDTSVSLVSTKLRVSSLPFTYRNSRITCLCSSSGCNNVSGMFYSSNRSNRVRCRCADDERRHGTWHCGASNAQPPQRCQRSPGTGIKSGQRMETKARRRVRLRQRDQNDNQSRSQGACASVCVRACARTTLHVGARAHVLVCRETAQNDTHTHTHTHTQGATVCV